MKKVNLAIGLHNHQPVGNFDHVFEEAYNKAYSPFLEILERHPKIRIAQHFTGILLEWIDKHKPGFIERLHKLVKKGQIEMMTGGYYEPILSVIPDRDKIGQIKKLTRYVKNKTGFDAKGMWLAERIWEPHLPKPCAKAGIEYLILDDSHFKSAGLRTEELYGYYVTEEEGNKVFLFPIAEKLRYTIPFQSPEETIEYLKSVANENEDTLVVFADDGEKFGIWPETYKHCYEDGWLEKFFQALEENLDWINIMHFSEVLEHIRPKGRIYLPAASYREMMEWAMPTQTIYQYQNFEKALQNHDLLKYQVFVYGGFWRNFMVKYPEANNMHKKMLRISQRLSQLESDFGDDEIFKKAQDHLWAGQCNCPYWHGVFGGLYLNHLRDATYHQLIQAESCLDKLLHEKEFEKGWFEVIEQDLDCDGYDEILVSTKTMNLYFSPDFGGNLFELDFKPKAINLLNTLTRREESYHKKLKEIDHGVRNDHQIKHDDEVGSIHDLVIMKEEGLEKLLFYDSYRRTSFLDHFFAEDTTLDYFSKNSYNELGDFIKANYRKNVKNDDDTLIIRLWCDGKVKLNNTEIPVHLEKKFLISTSKTEIVVEYVIKNLDENAQFFWFGIETDFNLLAGDAHDRYYFFPGYRLDDSRLRSIGEIDKADEVQLIDEWQKLRISIKLDRAGCIWRFPIETISQSEAGFERVYQGSVVLPNWKFHLGPGESWQSTLILSIEEI